jgi:hypothetical protein
LLIRYKGGEKMQRKGQAAMEFLMTYGWAILAAVIAIAVLAYFGVFSPGKSMPNICTLNAPLGCEEMAMGVSATGPNTLTMVVRNGAGDTLVISNLSVAGCSTVAPYYINISDGTAPTVVLNCTNSLGTKFSGSINVIYKRLSGTLTQTTTGTISGRPA